jgi:hypothetical protein
VERAPSTIKDVLSDRLFVGAFAVLWICALIPIWGVRFLPLLDFPNHLGAMAILHRFHDPTWGYDRFYTLNLKPVPYWGHYFPVHLLAYLMPLEAANKVWISGYALALPLGTAVLAKQIGRSPLLGLLAFPFVFSFCFAYGFLSFVGGVALFPWALASLEAFLTRPTRGRAVALTLLSLALYLMHVMPWILFGLFAGILLLSHGWHPKRMLAAAGCMLVSVAVALEGYVRQAGHYTKATTLARNTTKIGDWMMRFEKQSFAFKRLSDRWLTGIPDKLPAIVMIVFAVTWLALVVTSRRGPRRPEFGARYEIVLGLCIVAYFFLPQAIYQPISWWYISGRMTMFIAIVAVLVPRGAIDGWRRLLLVPMLIVSIAYPIDLFVHWRAFMRRATPFVRLMSLVPRGSSTMVLMIGDKADPDVDKNSVPYLEFHALAQVLAGGFDPWAQATPLGGFPMAVIPDKALPAPLYSRPQDFRMDTHGRQYDFILTCNESASYAMVPDHARLVAQDGRYRLYHVLPPDAEP